LSGAIVHILASLNGDFLLGWPKGDVIGDHERCPGQYIDVQTVNDKCIQLQIKVVTGQNPMDFSDDG
jgi:hypothetical protein